MQSISIIGAGRLGRTLGRLAQGQYRIAAVCGRSPQRTAEAVAFIGAGAACVDLAGLPASDFYLLSVPDDSLTTVAAQLAHSGRIAPGALVFHASGACELSVLAPLAGSGVRLGSLHPAFSFADPARAVAGFAGTMCALEGDDDVCAELSRFARALGGRPFGLKAGGKALYHASLSIASNFLVTLTGMAQSVAEQAGIDAAQATDLIGGLMRQTLDNTLALGAEAALTGPIARGDSATVARHLQALSRADQYKAYIALAQATLELARPRLAPAQYQAVHALLSDQ